MPAHPTAPRTWLWPLLALLAVAFALYWSLWRQAPILATDSPSYLRLAHELSSGEIREAPLRTPGYPLLLVLARASEAPGRTLFAVQLALHLSAVFLVCATLASLGAGAAGTLAAGAVGVLPPFVQPTAYVLTETLTQFCLVAAIACLARHAAGGRRVWLFAASLMFGYAALTRPTFQIACLLVGLVVLLAAGRPGGASARLADVGVLCLGTLLLVGGFAAYCQARFGIPGTTSTLGFNLANRCPELYEHIPDPVARRLLVQARNEAYASGASPAWAHFRVQPQLLQELGLTREELGNFYRRQFARAILAHPVEYAEIVAGSFARFWFPATGSLPMLAGRAPRMVWYAVHFLLMSVVAFGAAFFPAWLLTRRAGFAVDERTPRAWFLWACAMVLVLGNAVVSCMLETGETRYRASTDLLLVFAAGAGWIGQRGVWRALAGASRKLAFR
jgi:4-amino-4-deoxy-L-arabinose transferase-like glycosyltransferase